MTSMKQGIRKKSYNKQREAKMKSAWAIALGEK